MIHKVSSIYIINPAAVKRFCNRGKVARVGYKIWYIKKRSRKLYLISCRGKDIQNGCHQTVITEL